MLVSVDTFRYASPAPLWLKGNTHIHTTASDGGTPAPAVAQLYAGAGYDFLFRTDHWVCSDVAAEAAPAPLLWIDGCEIDGRDARGSAYHVVCLGRVEGLAAAGGLEAGLQAAREQGALLVVAHPFWTGNSLADVLHHRFDGVEVYNHVCHWLNGKSDGLVHWHALLRKRPQALALASDDAHLRPQHPGWNGGWIMVNAETRSAPAILEAIRRGRFYASCGPEFRSLRCADGCVTIETSPVAFARLVGPGWLGERRGAFDGSLLTTATFTVPGDWEYAFLEIEDATGRRAWTNTLFPPA
jgi:hypothetical protein